MSVSIIELGADVGKRYASIIGRLRYSELHKKKIRLIISTVRIILQYIDIGNYLIPLELLDVRDVTRSYS